MMWFFSSVPPHMNDKHVLSLKRFLISRAIFPLTNESLFPRTNVLTVQMLKKHNLAEFKFGECQIIFILSLLIFWGNLIEFKESSLHLLFNATLEYLGASK